MGLGNTFIVGVTGVIGSGKSMLCNFLAEQYGFHWIHADAITHELYKPEQPGYRKIKEYFGDQFVGKRGVHRGRLRRFILKSPQKLWILNQLIHPLIVHEVNKKIVQLLRKGKAVSNEPVKICIEAIYFEPKDLGKFIDELIAVHCPDEKILLKRLNSRKVPKNQLQTLIAFQRKNLPKFGIRIENTGSKEEFFKKVGYLLLNERFPRLNDH
jgi:dephospho-CoA kinase